MTNEEAIEYGNKWLQVNIDCECSRKIWIDCNTYEFFQTAIKALEQESCEDCISRKAVNDFIRSLPKWYVKSEDGKFTNYGLLYDDVMFGIDQLPSTTPKEKTGKWIVQHTNLSHLPSDTIVTCLECGHTKSRIDGEILNFCPKCGSRMVSE